jgi:hypothetical protein
MIWYYTFKDIAQILQVNRTTVYRYLKKADIPICQGGYQSHKRVLAVDLHAWMQYHCRFEHLTVEQQKAILSLVKYESQL